MNAEMELKNKTVRYSKEGRCCILTLNRPKNLNALTIPMVREIYDVLKFIEKDDQISIVIVTGEGRAFSVGVDFEVVDNLGSPDHFRKETREVWHDTFNVIEKMEKLFIAAINGITLGGALELALACDLRVAAKNAVLGLPEINFGLIPDAGGTIRLTRIVGPGAAKELILSGELISAEDAKDMGMIQKVFSQENFMDEVREYAGKFEQKSSVALGLAKIAVNRNLDQDLASGLEEALYLQSILLRTEAHQTALDAFKKKHHVDSRKT